MVHFGYMCLNVCLICACVASILVSCNESESEGSVPELEESEPLRPSEPQASAALLKTMFSCTELSFFNTFCLFSVHLLCR